MARIFWKENEEKEVIRLVAMYRLADPKIPLPMAFLKAQESCLPPSRRRPEASLKTAAYRLSEKVKKEMAEQEKVKREHEKSQAAAAAQPTTEVEVQTQATPEQPSPANPALTELTEIPTEVSTADQFIAKIQVHAQSIASDFAKIVEPMIYASLYNMYLSAAERASSDAAATMGKAAAAANGPSMGSVVNTGGKKFGKIKVGYVGGGQRGVDLNLVKDGLEDVYDFVIIDSLAKIDSMKNCQVLVKSKYCSHSLWDGAKRASPLAKRVTDELTPNQVNSLLLDWFANNHLGPNVNS